MRFVSLSRYGRATLPVLILLAGGAGDDSSGRAGPAADSEVRIGWYGPADADHPLAGGMWGAAELAVEEANAGGGFAGRPFRLVPSWSQNPWGSGIVGVTRMAYDEGVWAIVGAPDGPSAHLVEQVVAKARLTFVSPVATDPTANLANVPWVFSCAPSDDVLAQALAEAIVHDTDRVAVVSCTDHDSRIFTAELLAALQDREVFPVRHVKFRPGVAGFRTQLEALRIGGAEAHGSADPAAGFDGGTIGQQTPDAEPVPPSARSFESLLPCQGGAEGQAGSLCYPKRRDWEGLVVIAGPEDAARFLITLRQAGFSMPVYGGPRMGHRLFISLAGESAGGLVFPMLWDGAGAGAEAASFVQRFRDRFGAAPDYTAVLSYDAMTLTIAAIRRAGLDREAIRDSVRGLSPWSGVGGTIEWDSNGQNRRIAPLGTIRDGGIVPARRRSRTSTVPYRDDTWVSWVNLLTRGA